MPDKSPPIGEAGRNVAANIERLRKVRHLSLRQLSERLGELGRLTSPSALHQAVHAERRTDADDLVALAAALEVSPATLLGPPGDAPDIGHPALAASAALTGCIGQLLARPGEGEALSGYVDRALKRVQIEVEELLAETGGTSQRSRD